MGKIDLNLNFSALLQYATAAMEKKQWYLAVQNLNEAYGKCETPEEKRSLYLAYADLFLAVGNAPLTRYALFMASKVEYKGGYFSLDFGRFLPEMSYVMSVEEEEEDLSADQILVFNKIYTLISQKKYTDAIKLFFTLPFSRRNMAGVVDALCVALNADTKFDLDNYLVPLLPIIGEYASGDAEFVNLLLTGGENTRLLAVEGVKYFVEDNEDVELLRDMGEVYFLASEFECAKLFFEKILSICEIDESALYYMYAISLALKNTEIAVKYRAKFFTVCQFAQPPMRLIDRSATATRKGDVTEYLTLTPDLDEKLYSEIVFDEKSDIDEETFLKIKQFCCGGNLFNVTMLINRLFENKDKGIAFLLCQSLLESAFVTKEVKKLLLDAMIENGYEGILPFSMPEKALICETAKFRHRYGIWNSVYKEATTLILTSKDYIPYHSNVLASAVKKCYETIGQPMDYQEEDFEFLMFVAVITYVDRLSENVDVRDVAALFTFSPGEIEENLLKYGLKSPVL